MKKQERKQVGSQLRMKANARDASPVKVDRAANNTVA